MMSALIVEEASITLPILGSNLDEEGIISHPGISRALWEMLLALQRHARQTSDNPLQSA